MHENRIDGSFNISWWPKKASIKFCGMYMHMEAITILCTVMSYLCLCMPQHSAASLASHTSLRDGFSSQLHTCSNLYLVLPWDFGLTSIISWVARVFLTISHSQQWWFCEIYSYTKVLMGWGNAHVAAPSQWQWVWLIQNGQGKLFYARIYILRKLCTYETHEIKTKAATKISSHMVCRQRRTLTNVCMCISTSSMAGKFLHYQWVWFMSTHILLILAVGTFCITIGTKEGIIKQRFPRGIPPDPSCMCNALFHISTNNLPHVLQAC